MSRWGRHSTPAHTAPSGEAIPSDGEAFPDTAVPSGGAVSSGDAVSLDEPAPVGPAEGPAPPAPADPLAPALPELDAALQRLVAAADRPLAEQVEAYQAAHQTLQETLASIDQA